MSYEVARPPAPNESSFTDQTIESLVDLDDVLGSLSNRRRREVLSLLDERPVWTTDELADRIVHDDLTSQLATEVQVGLAHNHLSNLSDSELVEYDHEAGLVQRGNHYEAVRAMVDAASEVMDTHASKFR